MPTEEAIMTVCDFIVVKLGIVHCCTLSLCHLGSETDEHQIQPNINTEII